MAFIQWLLLRKSSELDQVEGDDNKPDHIVHVLLSSFLMNVFLSKFHLFSFRLLFEKRMCTTNSDTKNGLGFSDFELKAIFLLF